MRLRGAVTAFVAILTAVAVLVLVIACLNVGSVLLVRTMSRERELAVRLALGAGHRRLVRQLLAEAAILAGLGAAGGVLLAVVLNHRLATLLRSITAGLGLRLELDGRVLALTALAAVLAAFVAALAPALHILRKAPASALRSREGPGAGARARVLLVTGQVAVSVALVIATGLFVRALAEGSRADPGFDADRIATFAFEEGEGGEGGLGRSDREAVLADLRAVPAVEAVSVADGPPVGVSRTPVEVVVPGVVPPAGREGWPVDVRRVGADYLATLGVEIRAGRDVRAEDGPDVAVVSRAFVERFWTGGEVVGRTFTVAGRVVRIVGVAEDVQYLAQDPEPDPLVYLAAADAPLALARITLRARDPARLSADVRRVVARHVPDHFPPTLRTAREALDAALLPQRLGAGIVGFMGIAALLLAAVGLYGLVQYGVSRDARELAVRRALGGSPRSVLGVVLRKGFLHAGVGVLIGVVLAGLLAPALGAFLRGVSPRDPLTYGTVVTVFGVVALMASWLPARRASRVEPAEVLRGE